MDDKIFVETFDRLIVEIENLFIRLQRCEEVYDDIAQELSKLKLQLSDDDDESETDLS